MIILRKLFSALKDKEDSILSKVDTTIQELIKLFVFTKKDRLDIQHWSSELAGYIKSVEQGPKNQFSGSYLFLPLVDNYKNLPRRRINISTIQKLRGNKSIGEYIKSQYDFLYKQEDKKHGIKYKDLIDLLQKNNEIPEDEVFIQQAKYLLLRLNGQIGEDVNWYDPIVQSMQVNWELRLGTDRAKDIEEIIKNI